VSAVRIVVADDHAVVREGLCALLGAEPDMEVVGQARDGQEAVRLATELSPDVVILDVAMPGGSGSDAAREILRKAPSVKVLALSVHAEVQCVLEMLRAGALGYLLKTSDLDELLRAVRVVVAGQAYLSPSVAGVVVDDYVQQGRRPGSSATSGLTDRERQVLRLVAEGLATKQIAARLHLSGKTVEMHRSQIMRKLDIHGVAGLTKYAIREGLTSLDP